MSALGSLVVKLALEYAEYTRGLDKSGQDALKFAQRQQQALDKAGRAVDDFTASTAKKIAGAVAAYVSVTAAVDELKSSINDLAALDDMSQKTGASVENLSRMQKVTKQFGGDMSAIDPLLVKFAKGMAEVDSETSKTHKALKALGFSSQDLARFIKDPAQGMIGVSKALQQYQDDGRKTALVNDMMGKSAADQLPFLNDLAENVDKFTAASADSAARAAALQDQMGGLKVKVDSLFQAVAIDALPAMGDFVGALDDLFKSGSQLENNNSVENWADAAARSVAVLIDELRLLPRLSLLIGKAAEAGYNASRVFNPINLASELLHGKSPIDDLKKSLADAGPAFSFTFGSDEMFTTLDAVDARIAARGNKPASPYTNPAANRRTLNYTSGTSTATEAKVTDYQRLTQEVMKFNDAQQLQVDGGDKLTQGQTLALSIMEQIRAGTVKLTEAEKIRLGGMLESGLATEQVNIAQDERQKRVHEFVQKFIADYQEQQDALAAYEADWNNYLGGLENSLKSLDEQNTLYGLTATQIASVNLQRATEALEMAKTNGVSQDYLDRLSREVDLRKQILDKTGALEQKQMWTGIFDSIDRTAHDTFVSIFDSGKSAFDRLRDTLKNGLLDLLYQMTIKKWIFNIGALVTGGTLSGTAAAAATTAGQSSGLSFSGLLSQGNSLLGAISSGFDSMNIAFEQSIQSLGTHLVDFGFDKLGGMISQYSSTIANIAPFAGVAISLLKGDVKGAVAQGIGAGIGFSIGGPVGAGIGAALGSMVGGLFGGGHVSRPKYYANTSVSAGGVFNVGAFGNSDASGTGGGAAITPGIAIGQAVQMLAGKLGGTIDAAFVIGTKYMQKYNSLGVSVGRGISKEGLDLGGKSLPMERINDITALTFTTAIQKGLVTVDSYLERFVDQSKITLDNAVSTIDAMVSIRDTYKALESLPPVFRSLKSAIENTLTLDTLDAFKSRMAEVSTYYSLFYTDQEKLADSSKALHARFSELNVAFPESRQAFRSLVEGIDTTTSSGLDLFNTLVDMAPTMDGYYKALLQQKDALDAVTLSTSRFKTLVDFTRAQRYIDNGISTAGIPGFASGGDFGGGLRFVGERGPELEATGPSRITSTNDLMAALRNPQANSAALIAEIQNLRAENKAQQVAIAMATQKMAKILDKFDNQGVVLSETNNAGTRVVLDTRTVP